MTAVSSIHYIPLIPLVASAIIRFLGKNFLKRKGVHVLACTSVFASFLIALQAFFALRSGGVPLLDEFLPWIHVGSLSIGQSFLFDSLSATMTLIVTGVGFLIHVYSTGYMAHEESYFRYFAYLNLFMGMMLILVLANNLLLMFVGWEGVGLCSYLLIGFWFGEKANADAGKKAFVVNRIGDFGFIVGMLSLFWTLGMAYYGTSKEIWSLDFYTLRENAEVFRTAAIFGIPVVTFATLALFLGAAGKSAQIPLYVWLPDAMAGPTPVSALIHAATMVTAGVYMVNRLSFLFDLAPFTLHVVATVGALTALFAATIALVQNDIKKVLAYSTVSQLGYMFLACGVGAYSAGLFHVMTHAFFKALLFLGAGSVIHAFSGEQDLRKMGGVRAKLPWTYRTFWIGTVAIAGIPPFAGFFSKDEILWQVFSSPHGSPVLWGMGVCAAFLTAFYMFRLLYLAFHGECHASQEVKEHIHESPRSMILPLQILAFFSVVAGVLWVPGFLSHGLHFPQIFPLWLSSSVVTHPHEGTLSLEATLALISIGVAISGIFMARAFYVSDRSRGGKWVQAWPRIYNLLANKYWVDEIYEAVFVNGTKKVSALLFWFDQHVVDGLVNGAGWVVRMLAFLDGAIIDRYLVDGLVNGVASATAYMGRKARMMQTGQLQVYLGTLAGVFVAISLLWMSVMIGK